MPRHPARGKIEHGRLAEPEVGSELQALRAEPAKRGDGGVEGGAEGLEGTS